MSKVAIRELFLKKRKLLTSQEHRRRSLMIKACFFDSVSTIDKTIHCFLPITKNREVDTWPIIEKLKAETNAKLVVSKSSIETNDLIHYYLDDDTVLVKNKWGIPEPIEGKQAKVENIDIVLIPLLAFDHTGMRIGYGKGYYDKFLSLCRKDIQKIGLSVTPPIDKIEETDPYDIPMNQCITHLGMYSFLS